MQKYYDLTNKLWRDLCVIPAPSHHEDKRVKYISDILLSWGINAEIDEAKNIIVKLQGKTPKTVVFEAHTDVVFPDTEALPLSEDESKVYCPGCGDDTAGVALLMGVLKYIKDNDIQPENTILIVFNSCEEGLGNLKGTKAIKTEGGHSYAAFGNKNAAEILARGICKIYELKAPQEGGKTTYNVGSVSGGTSVNTIVQEAQMLCEYRSECYDNLEYMKKKFSEIFEYMRSLGGEVTVELVGERPCMKGVDEKAMREMTELGKEIQARHTGLEITELPSSTDCNIPHSMGVPALCMGTYLGGGAHTREEWVEKESLPKGFNIVKDIILHYFE